MLLRRGARVTLVDAWGPGNARASSGGETRVIRGVYGKDRIYTAMARRAFQLWHENEARWKKTLYTRTGALWMVADSGEFLRDSIPIIREFGFAHEELTAAEARKRYPQIDFAGIERALLEKEAGYLLARRSCVDVVEGFLAEGGTYREAMASPGEIAGGRMAGVRLSDGTRLTADVYVFACGPWLPKLFPDMVGNRIEPTRQDVHAVRLLPSTKGWLIASDCKRAAALSNRSEYASCPNIEAEGRCTADSSSPASRTTTC